MTGGQLDRGQEALKYSKISAFGTKLILNDSVFSGNPDSIFNFANVMKIEYDWLYDMIQLNNNKDVDLSN